MSNAKSDHFLAEKAHEEKLLRTEREDERDKYERALTYIANLKFPNEEGEGFTGWDKGSPSFMDQLRSATQDIWPQIWSGKPGEAPPEVPLADMRSYLQRCWDAHDERERDWHVHRAREYYQRHALSARPTQEQTVLTQNLQKAKNVADAMHWRLLLEKRMEAGLDQVPPKTFLERALFHLQKMANGEIANRRPLHCPAAECETPYFFSRTKSIRYCPDHSTIEQKSARKRANDLKAFHKNKAKYGKKGGLQ